MNTHLSHSVICFKSFSESKFTTSTFEGERRLREGDTAGEPEGEENELVCRSQFVGVGVIKYLFGTAGDPFLSLFSRENRRSKGSDGNALLMVWKPDEPYESGSSIFFGNLRLPPSTNKALDSPSSEEDAEEEVVLLFIEFSESF